MNNRDDRREQFKDRILLERNNWKRISNVEIKCFLEIDQIN